jgi:N-acylneuraminate cytidylyltransferase
MNVAVIPARGGSKRIPRKNIRKFSGKPIIAYSIEKALLSNLFDKVIVSTDNDEINSIAKQFGAEVPFKRSAQLSDDYAGTTEVVAHAIKWMENQGWTLNGVCCIYPTAPLLDVELLKISYDIFIKGKWDYVFSATEYVYPVERSFKVLDNNVLKMLIPENFDRRSQDLTPTFHDAGQFYWGSPEAWVEDRPIFSERSTIIKLPAYRAVDIDTEDDWKRAELLYKILEEEE